ncbi:SIMPL domain-containing protein [Melittangium boletus]|uniref:DUF541 domain-containing protein n=1 Tax=Melittangium boletus DSM 14713 TaxID=1294270 RepID=A0A250IBC1_9BACT|nr:hypothetical protein [Melittangium boletus]ATB29164.1 hypothetical protein MEBOL_002613 [Melittangium boletus DSM 14713]
MSFAKEKYSATFREPSTLRAELTVKPDLLRVSLSVSLEAEEVAQALPALRRACEQLQRRAQERLGAEVTFRPRDVRFDRASQKKLSISEDDTAFVALEGWLETPLGAELDFWARGARVGSLVRTCQEAESDSRQSKKLPRFGFGAVEALVARPEAHREELLRRFVARVQETAAALGSAQAPLSVVECSPAGAVEQTPFSLEEVGLSLPISCQLGGAPSERRPGN